MSKMFEQSRHAGVELLKDVYQVGGPALSHPDDATSYLLPKDDGSLYLIDCGSPDGAPIIAQNIKALGFDPANITRIYGSHGHYDHVGGAGHFDAALLLHPLDEMQVAQGDDLRSSASLLYGKKMPALPVSGHLQEGDLIHVKAGQLQVLHTPGHSPGSCSFLLTHSTGLRLLFAADALHGGFSLQIGSSEEQWKATLARLCSLEVDCYTFGHCPPSLLFDAQRRIRSLAQSFANYYNPWFKDFYRHYPY